MTRQRLVDINRRVTSQGVEYNDFERSLLRQGKKSQMLTSEPLADEFSRTRPKDKVTSGLTINIKKSSRVDEGIKAQTLRSVVFSVY